MSDTTKFETYYAALLTYLRTNLVGAGKPFTDLRTDYFAAENIPSPPIMGVWLSDWYRDNNQWIFEIMIPLITVATADVNIAAIALSAQVVKQLDAFGVSGLCNGTQEQPRWDQWVSATNNGQYQAVGAMGTLKVRFDDPLI